MIKLISFNLITDSVGRYITRGASAVVLADAIFDKKAMAQRDFVHINQLASTAAFKGNGAIRWELVFALFTSKLLKFVHCTPWKWYNQYFHLPSETVLPDVYHSFLINSSSNPLGCVCLSLFSFSPKKSTTTSEVISSIFSFPSTPLKKGLWVAA